MFDLDKKRTRAMIAPITWLPMVAGCFLISLWCLVLGAPEVTAQVSANPAADWTILVRWTAPGDDGNVGTATEYDLRYATFPITNANWNTATQAVGEPSPRSAGGVDSFAITGLAPLTTYYIAVKTRDEAYNWSPLSNVVSKTTSLVAGVGDEDERPDQFYLRQNYPNPFNPATSIECVLPLASHLSLAIYNMLGQHITQLVDRPLPAGVYSFSWDGTDRFGRPVASGTYFYRMEAQEFLKTRVMTLLR